MQPDDWCASHQAVVPTAPVKVGGIDGQNRPVRIGVGLSVPQRPQEGTELKRRARKTGEVASPKSLLGQEMIEFTKWERRGTADAL